MVNDYEVSTIAVKISYSNESGLIKDITDSKTGGDINREFIFHINTINFTSQMKKFWSGLKHITLS
jgi:hypothetical protein